MTETITEYQRGKLADEEADRGQRADAVRATAAQRREANILAQIVQMEGLRATIAAEDARSRARRYTADTSAMARVEVASRGVDREVVKALVDRENLAVMARVQAAKVGRPDEPLLAKVRMATKALGLSGPEASAFAWRTFYELMGTAQSGNFLGTHEAMSDPMTGFGPDPLTDAELQASPALFTARQDAQERIATERRMQADAQAQHAVLTRLAPEVEKKIAEAGGEANIAAEQWAEWNRQIRSAIPDMSKFAKDTLQAIETARREEGEGITDPALQAQDAVFAERIRKLEAMLGDAQEGSTVGPPDSPIAAWVALPQAQDWAARNGYRIGKVIEVTPENEADLRKRYPNAHFTKHGLYVPGVDDTKAARFALSQMNRDPRRNVLRAAGIGRGGTGGDHRSPELVEVTLKGKNIGVTEIALLPNGDVLAKLEDGTYRIERDGKYLPASAEQADGVTFEPAPPDTFVEVPGETVLGVEEAPIYDPNGKPGTLFLAQRDGTTRTIDPDDVAERKHVGGGVEKRPVADDVRAKRHAKLFEGADVAPGASDDGAAVVEEDIADVTARRNLARLEKEGVTTPPDERPVHRVKMSGTTRAKPPPEEKAPDAPPEEFVAVLPEMRPPAKPPGVGPLPTNTDPTRVAEVPTPDTSTPVLTAQKMARRSALGDPTDIGRKPLAKEPRPEGGVARPAGDRQMGVDAAAHEADKAIEMSRGRFGTDVPAPQAATTDVPTQAAARRRVLTGYSGTTYATR